MVLENLRSLAPGRTRRFRGEEENTTHFRLCQAVVNPQLEKVFKTGIKLGSKAPCSKVRGAAA